MTTFCKYYLIEQLEQSTYTLYNKIFSDAYQYIIDAQKLEYIGKPVKQYYNEINKLHYLINLSAMIKKIISDYLDNGCCLTDEILTKIYNDCYKLNCSSNCDTNLFAKYREEIINTFLPKDLTSILNIKILDQTSSSILIGWNNIGINTYKIETYNNSTNTLISTNFTTDVQFNITGLVAGTEYKIVVSSTVDCVISNLVLASTSPLTITVNLIGGGTSSKFTPINVHIINAFPNTFVIDFDSNAPNLVVTSILVNTIQSIAAPEVNILSTYLTGASAKMKSGTYTFTNVTTSQVIDIIFTPFTLAWSGSQSCITLP
jgi:hypothetical protein